MMNMSVVIGLSALSCMVAVVVQRRHLLMSLLAFEGMVLSLTLMVMVVYSDEIYSAFMVVTIGACEASLGLAVLVAMIRMVGNDMFMSANKVKC